MSALVIEHIPLSSLRPDPRNARVHSPKQIDVLARAIQSFGFNNPILIDKDGLIIAGHGRAEAGKKLGIERVPTIKLEHLSPAQVRAYRIADNRIAELAAWNEDLLQIEFQDLTSLELDFDLTLTGFETPEIDLLIMRQEQQQVEDLPVIVDMNIPVISKLGDLWQLGDHRLLCGDSLDPKNYPLVLNGRKADLVFTDPPYNVPIKGHVVTGNKAQHPEFCMASGEMTSAEFQSFLEKTAQNLVASSKEGSIHFICMDWRHIYDLLHSCSPLYTELKNICVWNKNNGGMGSLYRSKHEMIAVYKSGTASHTNNVELGKHGRYRTNVWDYAGQTSLHADRADELAMHPTVKPVRMIADAIYDCSHRGEIVLDPFGGSGSTLMAAEEAGRKACLIELEPRYIDVTIERWQHATKKAAIHVETGLTFDEMAIERQGVCFVRPL